MAKHKKNIPRRAKKLATVTAADGSIRPQEATKPPTSIAPKLRPMKWRPAIAHEKHKHDLDPPPSPQSTLSDRFNALPGELRERIFALLVVQPTKWDIQHRPDCPYTPPADSTPESIPHMACNLYCASHVHRSIWMTRNRAAWPDLYDRPRFDPWRSVWAPEQTNPYLCTTCFDTKFRPDKPQPSHLPCLCARRQHLQVLLVNKHWYAEASHIFYTRNIFAFEDARTFTSFMQSLSPHLRFLLRHVSIMASVPSNNLSVDPSDFDPKPYRKAFPLLRQLPNLATLELDSLFLTTNLTLQPLRRLGLLSLRRCTFVQRLPDPYFPHPEPFIHRGLARRFPIRRFLANEVAREIKGQHRRWSRGGKKVVQAYVEWECEDRVWRDLVEEGEEDVARRGGWWEVVGNGMFWAGEEGVRVSNLWGR